MDRLASRLLFASLLLGACSSASGPIEGTDGELAMEERLVGGWDGASTSGTSVLLIREGLSGTLSTTHLTSDDEAYELSFSIAGEVDEEDPELVVLTLACAEARMRPLAVEAPIETPDPLPSSTDETTGGETELPEERWDALDCAGWELQLECGLAGECDAGCNLFCDVTYFGDAFATAAIELASVEDELDHWQRV